MRTKSFPIKYLKRVLLVIAALMITALSLAFHRGTINARIPIDYTEDPYSIMGTDACR